VRAYISSWFEERGQVIVVVTGALVTLLLVVGMVIDVGIIQEQKRQLQNAVDAAALASARAADVDPDLAQAAAEEYLLLNGFDPADISLTITVNPNYAPDQVEVTATAVIPTAFFTLAGVDTKTVTVRAVGEVVQGYGSGDYAFVALSEDACIAFEKAGNSELTISGGGGIMVNSDCSPDAFWAHGNGSIDAAILNYFEEGDARVNGAVILNPEPTAANARIVDPLAGLPVPSVPTSPDSGGTQAAPDLLHITSPTTLQPGTFWGGIAVNSDVTLQPGIYVMAGGGLSTAGGGSLTGAGVLIYNTDNPGVQDCGSIVLTGSNSVILTPMTNHDDYEDITVWQDADCTETFTMSGGHPLAAGVIYAPGALFNLVGGGQLGSLQVFADTISVTGDADIEMDFVSYVGEEGIPSLVLAE